MVRAGRLWPDFNGLVGVFGFAKPFPNLLGKGLLLPASPLFPARPGRFLPLAGVLLQVLHLGGVLAAFDGFQLLRIPLQQILRQFPILPIRAGSPGEYG